MRRGSFTDGDAQSRIASRHVTLITEGSAYPVSSAKRGLDP
jgi:hypothetical protein